MQQLLNGNSKIKSEEVEEEARKGCSSISHWNTVISELEAVEHL